ncbi:MAG: PQQ-binding-like beta-propeller repeat protein [Planctomycetota bacterium]|nr:PQQ-binding-like beta-propeller repeat protein [Planctomycetota bacterium]
MNRKPLIVLFVLCLVRFFASNSAFGDNWPGWRGPTGQGLSNESDLPVKWSKTDNVRWKVPLPHAGNSSPIIWGDRVFLTQASEKTQRPLENARKDTSIGAWGVSEKRSLICIQRTSGKILWQRDVVYKEPEVTHGTNPFCSATPVTDGERVIAHHGSAGLVCYDIQGRLLWNYDHDKLHHIWGNASSPILYGDLVIIWCGPGDRQFLLAVDRCTGKKVWEHVEPDGNSGESGKLLGTWATPIIVRIGDQDQLIMPIPYKFKAFAPKTGRELWASDDRRSYVYGSAIFEDGVAVSGNTIYKLGLEGVVEQKRLRKGPGKGPHSGVLAGGYLYVGGVAPACIELATGDDVWKAQIQQRPGTTETWGSMVHAGDKLYFTDQRGATLVLAAGPKYQVVGLNKLNERTNASIAVSQGDILIRTWKQLWCIGKTSDEKDPKTPGVTPSGSQN